MALTTGCARCHDHKFDPIPTADYYAMAGIFGSTDTLTGFRNRQGGGNGKSSSNALVILSDKKENPIVDKPPKISVKELKLGKQLAELKEEEKALTKRIGNSKKSGKSIPLKNDEVTTSPLPKINLKRAQQRMKQLKGQIKRVKGQINKLAKARNSGGLAQGNLAMGVRDAEKISGCKIRIRGDVDNHGPEVARGVPQVLTDGIQPDLPSDSSGRLELARWMCSSSHPLTARVMVNRVWHHLFGSGIVRTVDNFGEAGERPSHPQLLDHLAVRFTREMGWSVKKFIRAVMLSHSYRLASEHNESNYAIDPDNILFWRANVRRLEAEALRDAMMNVAGTLNLEPAQGSLVQNLGGGEIGKSGGGPSVASFPHRSVYLPILRNYLPEFLQVFDFAEPASVIGRRDITTVSTQALFLLNDKFVIDQSRSAAVRLLEDERLENRDERIAGAYLLTFGRTPSAGELAQARAYLNNASGDGQTSEEILGGLLQALFASAEFRYAL